MMPRCLLPDGQGLRCDQIKDSPDLVTVFVSSTASTSQCPCCNRPSSRVHSHYERTLRDLPWSGVSVQVRWRSRRFFCDNPECPRGIFTERLPQVATSRARATTRMNSILTSIGFACGGEPGSRLAQRLGLAGSGDTLLRLIRRSAGASAQTPAKPRVLGVDDWAFRKGRRYGTMLCDLEKHRPIDLLPERSATAFSTWLQAHPGVQVISRDRGDEYIRGATLGAPDAIQVADRFHLGHNLQEALERVVVRHHGQLAETAKELAKARASAVAQTASPVPQESTPAEAVTAAVSAESTCAQQEKLARRARRLQQYERIVELHRQGVSQREIARRLDMHRGTVRRFVGAGTFPERAERRYHVRSDKHRDFLRRRWGEGCHNAARLTRELHATGATRSYHSVRRRVAGWRDAGIAVHTPGRKSALPAAPRIKCPSSRRIAWALMLPEADADADDTGFCQLLLARCPDLRSAVTLTHEFTRIVHQRCAVDLDPWIELAAGNDAPVEMHSFARGLTADLAAVRAALTQPWSNGQVEGQVNRLKLVKRQMYGRAGFELLRARFLHAA
jgi:transposase